jgi:phage replication O-like protein O
VLMPATNSDYFKMPNELSDALCTAELSGREFQVLNAIIRNTYGWQKPGGECELSVAKIMEITGIEGRTYVSHVVQQLEQKKAIIAKHEHGKMTTYRVNTNLSEWSSIQTSLIDKTSHTDKTSPKDKTATSLIDETSTSPIDKTADEVDTLLHERKDKDRVKKEDTPTNCKPLGCAICKKNVNCAGKKDILLKRMHDEWNTRYPAAKCPVTLTGFKFADGLTPILNTRKNDEVFAVWCHFLDREEEPDPMQFIWKYDKYTVAVANTIREKPKPKTPQEKKDGWINDRIGQIIDETPRIGMMDARKKAEADWEVRHAAA